MIHKNRKDHAEYWKKADEAAKEVAKWPKWKRDIQIGKTGAKDNSVTYCYKQNGDIVHDMEKFWDSIGKCHMLRCRTCKIVNAIVI